jgi:hypothetical protein
MSQSSQPLFEPFFPANPLPSRKKAVTPIVVATATPVRNATELRFGVPTGREKRCGHDLRTGAHHERHPENSQESLNRLRSVR